MSKKTDQAYLLSEQYRDATNLDARIELNRRFSTNPYGWMRWVFDQFDLPPGARILELGCGTGELWRRNLERVPAGWEIVLSDLSPGMLAQTQRNLAGAGRAFNYETIDAQEIPFEPETFDGVVANHVLHHVPDLDRALSEIHRVLVAGGRFYATTIGAAHMHELYSLVSRFTGADESGTRSIRADCLLENGAALLSRWFAGADVRRYADALVVTEAEPLAAYIQSMMFESSALHDRGAAELMRFLERELQSRGAIHITKDSGMLLGVRGASA